MNVAFFFGVTKFDCMELQDIGEHLTTIQLSCCDRGKRCLYEGSAPPGGFPNSWVCFSETSKLHTSWFKCTLYLCYQRLFLLSMHHEMKRMVQAIVHLILQSWKTMRYISGIAGLMMMETRFNPISTLIFTVWRTFIWFGVSCLIFQVWGPKEGPYEFKPAPSSSSINSDVFSPLNMFPQSALDKPIKGSFILQE